METGRGSMDGPGNWLSDANDASTLAVHVHDVVTDWSYALAGFLVSTLFGVSPGQSPSNFSHCKCFSIRIPFLFQYKKYNFLRSSGTWCGGCMETARGSIKKQYRRSSRISRQDCVEYYYYCLLWILVFFSLCLFLLRPSAYDFWFKTDEKHEINLVWPNHKAFVTLLVMYRDFNKIPEIPRDSKIPRDSNEILKDSKNCVYTRFLKIILLY